MGIERDIDDSYENDQERDGVRYSEIAHHVSELTAARNIHETHKIWTGEKRPAKNSTVKLTHHSHRHFHAFYNIPSR